MSDDTDDVVIEESTEDGDTGTAEQKLKKLRDALHKAHEGRLCEPSEALTRRLCCNAGGRYSGDSRDADTRV